MRNAHLPSPSRAPSNGAHANSNLTNMGIDIPDTRAQVKQYLNDVKNGSIANGDVLYVWWIGINPITTIWTQACDPQANGGAGARYPKDEPFVNATNRIVKQIEEVRNQVSDLRGNKLANKLVIFSESLDINLETDQGFTCNICAASFDCDEIGYGNVLGDVESTRKDFWKAFSSSLCPTLRLPHFSE